MSTEALKAQILRNAWDNPEFKQRLIEQPKIALMQILGFELPKDVELRVVEETPSSLVFVIPPNPEEVIEDKSERKYHWV